MKSFDLEKSVANELIEHIARFEQTSDCPDEHFNAAFAGLESHEVESMRGIAEAAGHIRVLADVERICRELGGSQVSKKLASVLRRIRLETGEQFSERAASADDFIRSVLIVVYGVKEPELTTLTLACHTYSKNSARLLVHDFSRHLRGSSAGEACRQALELTDEPLEQSAKRARVTVAAICKAAKRIRQKLHGEG